MSDTIIKPFMLSLFCLMLNACGGSGGGSEDAANVISESPEATLTETVDIEPVAVEQALPAMRDLVAAKDFTFTTKNNIQLQLTLNDYQQQRAYVSLYSAYQKLPSGRYYPDSASRVIGGALQSGTFEQSFIGLNNQQQYLIEVWFYDGREPLQKELLVNNKQLIWQ